MPSSQDRDVRFAGWRMVAFATIAIGLTGPGQTIGVSVFIDHFATDLDLEKSWVTAGYMVGTLCGSLALPTIGRWIDHYGVRRSMTAIVASFAIALVFMSGVQGIISLTVGFVFIRMLGQGSLSLVSMVSISLWFERRRGLAISIAVTIGAALMALVPFALDTVIGAVGWRWAWVVAAATVAAVALPIAWFGMIDRPSSVGQHVDGVVSSAAATADAEGGWGIDRATAIRRYEFWVLAGTTATMSMLITGLNFHQVALLGESGFTSAEAAALFLPQMIGSTIGTPAMGLALDRVGARYAPAVQMALLSVALIVAGTATSTPAVIAYATWLGLAGGAARSLTSTLAPTWFGTAHLGAIQGSLTFAAVLASAAGPFAFSLTEIGLGGYRETAALWAIIPIALCAGMAFRPPHAQPLRPPG